MASISHGAGFSSCWISSSSLETQRLQRIQLQGSHIGVSRSPYFPKNLAEYLAHQAAFKKLQIEDMKQKAEVRGQEKKAERESGVRIPRVGVFLNGKIIGDGGDDGRGGVLGWRTVFRDGAENEEVGIERANWPSVGEWKREGEGRKKEGKERRLALPRLERLDEEYEAWRQERGIGRPEGRELDWMEKEVGTVFAMDWVGEREKQRGKGKNKGKGREGESTWKCWGFGDGGELPEKDRWPMTEGELMEKGDWRALLMEL